MSLSEITYQAVRLMAPNCSRAATRDGQLPPHRRCEKLDMLCHDSHASDRAGSLQSTASKHAHEHDLCPALYLQLAEEGYRYAQQGKIIEHVESGYEVLEQLAIDAASG